MRIPHDYETAMVALVDGMVTVIAFSATIRRSKSGSPYRRFMLISGADRFGGGAFIERGAITLKLPPREQDRTGVAITFEADGQGRPIEDTGRIKAPGRAEAPLQAMPR